MSDSVESVRPIPPVPQPVKAPEREQDSVPESPPPVTDDDLGRNVDLTA